MPEPGWYPDPGGTPVVRWWDGTMWTAHTQPVQGPSPQVPVLDAMVGKHRLYADAQVISYGGKTLRLAAVDWVAYFVKRPKARFNGPLIGSRKSSLGTYFYFQIGHHPYFKGEFIEVCISKWRDVGTDPLWEALAEYARRHVEPRLVSEIAAQVRAGRTVTLGPLTLDPNGIRSSRGTFGWRDLSGAAVDGDEIQLFNASAPVLRVSMANWNVSLLPALIPAIRGSG